MIRTTHTLTRHEIEQRAHQARSDAAYGLIRALRRQFRRSAPSA